MTGDGMGMAQVTRIYSITLSYVYLVVWLLYLDPDGQ